MFFIIEEAKDIVLGTMLQLDICQILPFNINKERNNENKKNLKITKRW